MVRIYYIMEGDLLMFMRVYKVKQIGMMSYKSDNELVINTSQIVSINMITKYPSLLDKNKYEKIFDTIYLSVFEIKLSNGNTFLIIGSTQKYENIK